MTEVVARIGQLLMEDLLSMHAEFLQFYGADVQPASPKWMKWEELEKLSPELKQVVLGEDGEELGAWMPLYRFHSLPLFSTSIFSILKFEKLMIPIR